MRLDAFIAAALALSALGCDGPAMPDPGRVDWYGQCDVPFHNMFDFTIRDLRPAPEGAVLAGAVGDWRILEGTADVTGRLGSTSEGGYTVQAICLDGDTPCSVMALPFEVGETLVDIRLVSPLAGRLTLKGLPDDVANPQRYTGECRHTGVSETAGRSTLSRMPVERPDAGVDAGPACPGQQIECGGGCVEAATAAMHCGVCGNACAEGACVLGQCPEQRRRRRAFAFDGAGSSTAGTGGGCVIRSGDVYCFEWTGARTGPPTTAATEAYGGGDAVQAAVHQHVLCVAKTDGSVECMERGSPSTPPATVPDVGAWTAVTDMVASGTHFAALEASGRLSTHNEGPDTWAIDPHDGISALFAGGLTCWQELAGPVRCRYFGQEDRYSLGPLYDFAHGESVGAFGIDADRDVVVVQGTEPPRSLDQGGALQVVAGRGHVSALTDDGRVHTWIQQSGAVPAYAGAAFGLDDAVAIRASVGVTCAERSDASVLCWRVDDLLTLHPLDLSAVP